MRKYHSRLNTLLKIKSKKEEDAQIKLINRFRQLQEMWAQKKQLEIEVLQLTIQNIEEHFSVDTAEAATNYIEYLQKKKIELSELIEEKVQQVEQARLEMIETMKQKKVIENIENKEKNVWKKKSEKQEEQNFDDLSTSRFLKKKEFLKQQLKGHDEKNRKNPS